MAAKAALKRAQEGHQTDIDEVVVMGCIGRVGPTCNARRVALGAGVPDSTRPVRQPGSAGAFFRQRSFRSSTAAMDPTLMGYARVLDSQKQFERTGKGPADIDVIGLNEALAAQAVAVIRDARPRPERTDPYSGTIALGHSAGATGAMCLGGGQALATLFRRFA